MLARECAKPILDQLKEDFEFVIADSAPVLPVTDALLIAQCVDGVVFAIRRDVSRFRKVAAACQRMNMLGIPVLGTVVIGLDESSYGYRYPYPYYALYGYGGYGYGAYGPYGYHTQPEVGKARPTG